MARWVNVVETSCSDPSREDEYNDWYDNVHVPDVLETPGFLAATRYMIKEPQSGRRKYLAVYEIETADVEATMALRRKKRVQEREQGRYTDLLEPGSEVLYSWISTRRRGE